MSRHRVAATILVIAAFLAGCRAAVPAFHATSQSDFNGPLPVTVVDETGLVTDVQSGVIDDAAAFGAPTVSVSPDDPKKLSVAWMGGMCDNDAEIRFVRADGKYALTLAIHGKFGLGGCPAAGVFRAVEIATTEAIPIDQIAAAGGS